MFKFSRSHWHLFYLFSLFLGSGNVLKIQKLLHILSEKYEEKTDKGDKAKSASASSGAEKSKSKDHHHHKKDSRRNAANASSRRTRRRANSTSTKPSTESAQTTSEEPMQVDSQSSPGSDDSNATSNPAFDYHAHQGLAVLGVAIIAMGEEVGLEMAFRMFGHLVWIVKLFYGIL